MKPPMLAGMTLPLEYQAALQDWRYESRERRRALEENPSDLSLPMARGFFSYAQDPNADGDDSDSLFLEPWWGDSVPGRNQSMLNTYSMSLRDEVNLDNGFYEGARSAVKYGVETIAPSAFVKTSMGDYVPNMFNIFTNRDGSRLDPTNIESFWGGTGANLGTGVVGYLLIGGGIYLGIKFGPTAIDGASKVTGKAIKGTFGAVNATIEGLGSLVSSSKKAAKSATKKVPALPSR